MSVIDTCKRQFKSLFGGKSETNVKHQQQQEYQANMTGTAVAKVNGVVVAETDDYETVEGNIYFPPSSLKREYYTETNLHTSCPWKGKASYYSLNVNGKELKDVAWYYPTVISDKAKNIEGYVAFYKNKVDIST